jgi:hypothetical protein
MTQADAAFKELKKMMSTPPILASLLLKEPMLLYIAVTNRVVSAVVVEQEEEGKTVQRPVYYLSEVLSTSKQNYPHYQKMTYGVYMASKNSNITSRSTQFEWWQRPLSRKS